jgi:uncharacterized membrane protein
MDSLRNSTMSAGVRKPGMLKALFAGCLAILASATAHADYVFTTVDYPGSTYTNVVGMNNTGAIVGIAADSSGNDVSFVYSGGTSGTFAALPPTPGGLGAAPFGINDAGTIVGASEPADGSFEIGFLLIGSTYTFFSHPPQGYTEPRSINAAGFVTGATTDYDAAGNVINNVGFIYDPATGIFTDILIPNATSIIAQGMNAAGQVVGNAFFADGSQSGFLRQLDGTLSLFKVNGRNTRARGINNNGLITGFIQGGLYAFVGNSSGYQLLQASPTAQGTFAEGINDSGQISGFYIDAAGTTHGFIASPASLPTGTTSAGAYTFTVDVVPNTPIFIDPAPALGFDYATGAGDPLFTTVTLPIGIGDNQYMLMLKGHQYPLIGGQLFDFTTHGYPGGVSSFRVTDIEVSAGLDPNNPTAFPTQLSFSGAGRFTGSMTPLCLNQAVPPQMPAQARRQLLAPCK